MKITDYFGIALLMVLVLPLLCFTLWASAFTIRQAVTGRNWKKCMRDAERRMKAMKAEFPGCEGAMNMYLEQRFSYFNPPSLNLATNTILGTPQQWAVERTWPIEEIICNILFTVTTALTPTVAGTPDSFDGILNLAQRINLSINDGKTPRAVVDVTGVGLLEYLTQCGYNLDAGTNQLIGLVASGQVIPTGSYQLSYRIPMVNPMIGEGLRSRMYLPVHKMSQDPILKVTFNSLANMGYGSGAIGNVYVETVLVRRVPTASSEAKLVATAPSDQAGIFKTGYIPFDLVETQYTLPLAANALAKLDVPLTGQYVVMVLRSYRGGSTLSRNVIDNSGIGDTVGNGFGAESDWRMEIGGGTIRSWRWRQLRTINDWSRPQAQNPQSVFVGATSAGAVTTLLNVSPNFGAVISGNLRAACSVKHDFLLDGMSGDTGNELSSLLDANTPANSGAKIQIIGQPASVATNASQLFLVGHRLFGDLSNWQQIQ